MSVKRQLCLFAALLLCALAGAQDGPLAKVEALLEGSRISFNYSYEVLEGLPVKGSGAAVLQGNSYVLTEGTAGVFCNGTDRWTVDTASKEVYIEAAGGENDIFGNVSSILRKFEGLRFDGKTLSGKATLPDGRRISCTATILKRTPESADGSFFVYDTSRLDSSWVITDLR